MAVLSTQSAVLTGTTLTYASCAGGGDKFRAGEHTMLAVTNASGGAILVTVNDPNSDSPTSAAGFNPDVVVSVGAGTTKIFGPFPASRFRNSNDGMVDVTYNAVVGLSIAVVSV